MNNVVINPYEYFADPTKGRPIFNGFIYIGEPDTDPEVPANQKQVYARQEDGNDVAIPQPVLTNAGGYPTYNGSVVIITVQGSYSVKVNDKQGNQLLYQANATLRDQGALPLLAPRAIGDGVETVFASSATSYVSPNYFTVTLDGVKQRPVTDYDIDLNGNVVLVSPAPFGAKVDIIFYNADILQVVSSSNATVTATPSGVSKTLGEWTEYLATPETIEVTASGTTTKRSLADRFADVVNVRDFESLVVDGDWSNAFNSAAALTLSEGKKLIGAGDFSISSDINLRFISLDLSASKITCVGTAKVILGGNAGSGNNPTQSIGDVRNSVLITDPEINLNPSIRVMGAKGQEINVRFCDYLQFYQSTNPLTYPADASQAYSTFNLGYCIKVSIDTDPAYDGGTEADGPASANQWFNENKINIPRCKGFYMRGSYKHNNNIITGGAFEGDAYLVVESGSKNHFKSIRFEGSTYTLTLGANTLGNTIERSWFGSEANFWLTDYTDDGQLNNVSSTTIIRATIDKVHEVSVDDIQHDGFNGNYNKRQPSKDKLKSSISYGILTESDFISVADTDYLFFTGELYTAADPLDSSTWGSAIVRVDFYDIRYKPVTIDESWFESYAFSKVGDNRLESLINGFGQTRLGLAGSSDIKYCKVIILSSNDRTKDLMRKISVKRFSNRNPIIEYFSDKAGLSENYKITSLPTKAIMPLGTSLQKTDGLARYVCTHSIHTELSANGSGVSISVLKQFDSTSGSTLSGDLIGVELDNNEVHWTTVSSISGLNITLTSPIPSAASIGSSCYITRLLTV